jgi:hypothetical protein
LHWERQHLSKSPQSTQRERCNPPEAEVKLQTNSILAVLMSFPVLAGCSIGADKQDKRARPASEAQATSEDASLKGKHVGHGGKHSPSKMPAKHSGKHPDKPTHDEPDADEPSKDEPSKDEPTVDEPTVDDSKDPTGDDVSYPPLEPDEPSKGKCEPKPGSEKGPGQSPHQSPGQTPSQKPPEPAAPCGEKLDNLKAFRNALGQASTFSESGSVDLSNAFFESLGTNGRTCGSCHDPRTGWSITPALMRQEFEATAGTSPVFRVVDGSVSPLADVSSVEARRAAYKLLLDKGLIRVGLPVPSGAEFELAEVDDPYAFASSKELSLFRRPLPSTNLRFQAVVMWDGRESRPGQSLTQSLFEQANAATVGHAQGAALGVPLRQEIVSFETALFTAQITGQGGLRLDQGGAKGGALELSQQSFSPGINSPLNPQTFNPEVFTLYTAWLDDGDALRSSIARGERIFNTKLFKVRGVRGLNDLAGLPEIELTCSGCHNAPNAGSSSIGSMMDLGLSDGDRRRPDMPLYTFRNVTTGEILRTTDPGRALITGKWGDMGRFKVPALRGLAARAPYFHNGVIGDVAGIVQFYDRRFQIGLTEQEAGDLAAFLGAL